MVSKDWMNVGQSFATPPVASTSRATRSASYGSSKHRGPEQASSAPRTTQARLFSLDKAPLVTPRASASAPRPTQKQATLDAFTSKTATARGKKPMRRSSLGPRERGTILGQLDSPRRPVSSLARRDSARTKLQVYRDDEELVTEEAEEKPVVEKSNSWIKSIFGRDDAPADKGASTPSRAPVSSSSSSSKGKSRSIGRDILSKPARRGPTIEFDQDLDTDLSYSQEMLGEQERRKRRRIEGSGPAQWGKLELCDAEDHEGFGSPHRGRKNRQSAKASRPSQSARGAGHREPVISVGSESSDGGEAELEADRKPLVARSQRQLDLRHHRLVPASPRAPSPRKRSRQTPPASPAWLAPPTPSPSSSGSSAGSTAAALQAQLVPPRRESSDRLEERHESSSRPAKTAEPAVLVPNSDPLEPSLEDVDSGPEPSTLDSSSGSNENAAETTPRKALPPPAASAPITAKRRGDDSGFSEGGVLMTSDDATPRPLPAAAAAAALNSTRLDLTGLPTSSPTVPPLRRTLRPNADVAAADDDEEQVGTSAQLGRTASGVLMPPPPLPVSPQKRLTRLRKGAPSSRAASLADKEAAAAAAASSAVDDNRSPPETMLEGTQYLLPDGRSGLGDEPVLVTDSYPFLFAPVPRPNPAKGYTPIRFGDQDDARLPTPHAKESPLTHKIPLLPQRQQPTTSSPIRAPVEAQDACVEPAVPPVMPEKVVTSAPAMGVPTAAAGWASSVAPAWEGARPPSPNAPRQSRLGEFFTTVPSSQAHADGREEEEDDDDDETQLVEDSQQMVTGMAVEETALSRAVMQLRPRMNEMRAATATTPDRKRSIGARVITGDLDDIVEEHEVDEQRIESPSKPITPVKTIQPSRASPSPSPSPSAYVEDSDPEGDALASPFVAGVLRSTSTSPTKPTAKGRRLRSFGGAGGRLDGPASVPRYSPTKIKRAAAERQRREQQQEGDDATMAAPALATEEEEPAAKGTATDETQWESYWSYPSEPVAGPSGAGAAPAEGVLDCSPRKLAELIAKVKALPPDLPPDWAVDENGELYRLDEDRWDPDQYPITESLLHVLE